MSTQDQLEIIRADGVIEFYQLDPAKGITNIGSHVENDIVLEGPDIAPFHAMLDHRQKPFQLTILTETEATRVSGQPLLPHTPRAFQPWDDIEIDGHRIILAETGDATVSPGPVVSAAPAAALLPTPAPPPPIRPEPPGGPYDRAVTPAPGPTLPAPTPALAAPSVQRPSGFFPHRPPDQDAEAIIVELSEREWTVQVEQTTTLQVTITNGGPLVANFGVTVQGLDPSWLEFSQPSVNIFEGQQATITISITPPRQPASRAGAHHFAVLVSSNNYPGYSQRGATLHINPYYEFAVGELSPRRQTIAWSKHVGQATVLITNKGNNDAPIRLEGADEERACSFEFDVPGEAVALATQAELRVSPEESIYTPLRITPHTRRLIGLRKRTYNYTITANLLEGGLTPRSMLGELKSAPLIGPWLILLMSLLLILLLAWIVRPRLTTFMFTDGGREASVSNGTPVAIRWGASFFTTDLAIEPPLEGVEQPLPRHGTVVALPTADQVYHLRGGNLLSNVAPAVFAPPTKAIGVKVIPIPPQVTFAVTPTKILGEGEVVLTWEVQYADKIELFRQVGDSGPIEPVDNFSGLPAGSLRVTPEPNLDTTYILVARNLYVPTPTPVPQLVRVLTPTPTAPPTPNIISFLANPPVINEGEESILSWFVDGVQEVVIQGIDGSSALPAQFDVSVRPTGSTDYVLTVTDVPPRPVRVYVTPATPTPTTTPEPEAPEIIFFTGDPEEVVKGDSTEVELTWKVVGTTTNVELSSPELSNPLANLQIEGSFKITLDDTALFVLTAFNNTAKSSASVQIEAKEPTATVPPTPIPAQIIEFEIIAPGTPQVDEVSPGVYQVQRNTEVTFQWQTNNAANKVIFTEPGGGAEVGTVPVGQIKKTITSDGNYSLVAENAEGKQTPPQVIQIEVVDQPPPNPPFNVNGVEDSGNNENEITWNWIFEPGKSDIIGFRVYRADVPPGSDYSQVAEILDPNARNWTDNNPGVSTCGKAYYVVAIYRDVNGAIQQSDVSTNTWFSAPCSP